MLCIMHSGIVDYVTDTSRGLLERLHLKRGIVQDPEVRRKQRLAFSGFRQTSTSRLAASLTPSP